MPHQRFSQKFKKEWLADPLCKDWLAECPGDATKALCKYCRITICARYASIKQHVAAKKHSLEQSLITGNSELTLCTKSSSNSVAMAEGRRCLFIAEHCAVNSCDHLTECCKRSFADSKLSKEIDLHRTKCSAVI